MDMKQMGLLPGGGIYGIDITKMVKRNKFGAAQYEGSFRYRAKNRAFFKKKPADDAGIVLGCESGETAAPGGDNDRRTC